MRQTLKALLEDALRVRKILSREDVKKIAREHGFEESSAERRLRSEDGRVIPCVKLNSRKQPIKESEHIIYYLWVGGETVIKSKNKKKLKKRG